MGRGLDSKLRYLLDPTKFSVQSVIKPYACFEAVTESVSALTNNFDSNDYVVIMAGYNDYSLRNVAPNYSTILKCLKECTHTNVIILSPPICFKCPNNCMSFNIRLRNLIYNFDKCTPNKLNFVDICDNRGRKNTNFKISEKICSLVNFSNIKNLTYIKLNENISNLSTNYFESFNSSTSIGDFSCLSNSTQFMNNHSSNERFTGAQNFHQAEQVPIIT